MSVSHQRIDNMKSYDANSVAAVTDKKEVKDINDDKNDSFGNGFGTREKRINGVVNNAERLKERMNGGEIEEDKSLKVCSPNEGSESVNEEILNQEEATNPNESNFDNIQTCTDNIKGDREIVANLKEEILKSELEEASNNIFNDDTESMEVEEILKNDESNENLGENQEVIPSPIEVNKHMRISDQLKKIAKLREELRSEEAALALLRKLIDSQRGKSIYKSKHSNTAPNIPIKQQNTLKGSLPPVKQTTQPLKQSSQTAQKYYVQVGNQLVSAPPPATPGSTSLGGTSVYQYTNGTSTSIQPSTQQIPSKPATPKQTPEQKQNAAKAALRWQLEQTLLQILPPRPPPADWKVVPNVNSMDFMMLVGLDEVVDMILDMDSKPTLKAALEGLAPFNPRICSQCKVDFSPCWKFTKDADKKALVLCERCSLQNIKKELKVEHTSRLKSAFLKALKQEQEIEEKIKAGEDVNLSNITGNDKSEGSIPSPQQQVTHMSSPKPTNFTVSPQPVVNHSASPSELRSHQSSSSSSHHRHQVVQHYPHNSLVQQLHHQHIQQQQIELEPPNPRHSSRWHPYLPSSSSSHHQHRDHHNAPHRPYVPSSNSTENSSHPEYYVVHHPQHTNVRYVSR